MTILFSMFANHPNLTQVSQVKRVVSLVIENGHFNLPQKFMWVCMGKHTHFGIWKDKSVTGALVTRNSALHESNCSDKKLKFLLSLWHLVSQHSSTICVCNQLVISAHDCFLPARSRGHISVGPW